MQESAFTRMEVCVDSIASAEAAERGGATRIELCTALFEGGLTPSYGLIQCVRSRCKLPIFVMIRPRSGDFCYSEEEFEVMKTDIELCKTLKVEGVVFGILKPDASVDTTRMKELIELARPLQVTFHRAFDMTSQPLQALEDLISLGVERILTSGLDSSCLEGLPMLQQLVRVANRRITIVPGGGITERNLKRILEGSGASDFHVSARTVINSSMHFRNTNCFMGGVLRPAEFSITVTDEERVRQLAALSKREEAEANCPYETIRD
jgi:copper homeostasis protein